MNNFCIFDKLILLYMKNWKTTLAGLVAGIPFAADAILQAYTAGYFTDKTGLQLFGALAVIVIASLAKDHNVTGGNVVSADAPPEPPIDGSRPGGR